MEKIISDLMVGGGIFVLVSIIGIPIFALLVKLFEKEPINQPNPRQIANLEILMILIECAKKYPDMRFGQILINSRTVDHNKNMFYEESVQILERMKKDTLL